MIRNRTPHEDEFVDYFRRIDRDALETLLADYRSVGPRGYDVSLVLARILKVKERISSDRELAQKLARIEIYRRVTGIGDNHIPSHNTFNTLRRRLGAEGFAEIHRIFALQAWRAGLLTPPIKGLPKQVVGKIILTGDSTFLKAVASHHGKRNAEGNWMFSDDSAAYGKPHHKHKYPVGHRAHSLITVSGIPLTSVVAPANESDNTHIEPLLSQLLTRYPGLPFGAVILDAGYDSDPLQRHIYEECRMLPVVVRKTSMKWGAGMSNLGAPLCHNGYATKRKGIEYANRRTKFACHRACLKDGQGSLFPCPHKDSGSAFGWTKYTYFRDDYRRFGPAVPGARPYETLKKLRTGIERYYGLTKENRYRMEHTNTYMGRGNVLIHVLEHDIVAALDLLYQHAICGKWSDVLKI